MKLDMWMPVSLSRSLALTHAYTNLITHCASISEQHVSLLTSI